MNSNIYLVFIDDISKFSWVYLLKFKFDVFNIFKYFKDTIENQLNLKLRFLDQMVEVDSHLTPLQTFALCKVLYMNSPIHVIPKQNGVAMRKHKRFCECSLTMLSNSKLPLSYWSYVVTTTIHIINRIPTPWLHHKSP